MNQLLIGAFFPFVFMFAIYACRNFRASFRMLVAVPVFIALSMIWAVIPDFPRLFGARDLYYRLALDPRCNIFYWHYTIDLGESDSPWYGAGLAIILACILAAAWRELALAEAD